MGAVREEGRVHRQPGAGPCGAVLRRSDRPCKIRVSERRLHRHGRASK